MNTDRSFDGWMDMNKSILKITVKEQHYTIHLFYFNHEIVIANVCDSKGPT